VDADEELYKAYFTHEETKDIGVPKELDCYTYLEEAKNGKVELDAE